jgi:tungstate transport system substrate-binding protein
MRPERLQALLLAVTTALAIAPGCGTSAKPPVALTLATTTSTQESGLLDALIPRFRDETGVDVRVVAVGSGQALELGRRGDADVLLTHAPAAELTFMEDGWGEERRLVMHNDFVLVGPAPDPAKVKGQASITEAFSRIADEVAPFVSRGDESGTHQKEKEIWKKAGQDPQGAWYIQAGTGMAQALRMANEKQAYTLADRATFLTLRNELELVILTERDPLLQNDYAVLVVSSTKHPHVKVEAARQFADFWTSRATKRMIAEFGLAEFGEPLFVPVK